MINAKRLSSLSDYRNPAPLPAQDASPEGSPTLASGLANYPPPSTAGSLLRLVPPPGAGQLRLGSFSLGPSRLFGDVR